MNKLKKIIIVCTLLFTFCTINVSATEEKEFSSNITPRSGGVVGTEFKVEKCTPTTSTWKYVDLVGEWGKTSKYIITKTSTVSSSTSFTAGIIGNIKEQLKANFGVNYGTSVSNSFSVGREYPADPKRNSKIRFKVQMKKYNVKVKITEKYYDTSLGNYNRVYTKEGTISIPNKNEAYIEVYYK